MSITATGPILLLMGLYIFFFKPDKLAYYAVFFAPFSATAVVNLSGLGYKTTGLGITPAMMFLLLFFVSQFIYNKISKQFQIGVSHLIQISLLVMFITSMAVSSIYNAAIGHPINPQATQAVYLLIGLIATILLSLDFTVEGEFEKFIKVARASAIFVSLWGLLQLICSIVHIPYPDFLFNNSNSDAADMFNQTGDGSFTRIASVAVEPSVFASSLLHFTSFGFTLISRNAEFRTRYWIMPVVLCLIVLLLCTSSTGYIGLAVLSLLLMLERPIFSLLIGVPALAVISAIIVSSTKVQEVLLSATINKHEGFSYMDRAASSANDLSKFFREPILGFGWGSAANFNGLYTILGSVGIVGLVLFFSCGLYTIVALHSAQVDAANDRLKAYAAGVRNALLVALVCASTSGIKYVFLDDWVYWAFATALFSRMEIISWKAGSQRRSCIPLNAGRLVKEAERARAAK